MQKSLCAHCKNYLGNIKCFAFPKKIPSEILYGKENHDKVISGQANNIVYEEMQK
jgi:hypothetical protein